MRNYNTTNGTTYPRVVELKIVYPSSGVPRVTYFERMAIVDTNQTVQHLESPPTSHVLDLTSLTEPVRLVNPTTGEEIAGEFVTSEQVMLGLLAFLRADQIRRDSSPEQPLA